MRNWRKTSLVAVGAITSGFLLTYDVRANEQQRVAQAQTQTQSQLGQPTGLEQPSGIGLPPVTRPRTQRRTSGSDRNTRNTRNTGTNRTNGINRNERRIPIPDVPFPDERFRKRSTPQQQTLPRSSTYQLPVSGISGQIVIQPICSVGGSTSSCVARPYQGALKVMPASRDRTIRLATDEQGLFQLRLEPGVYIVQPDSSDFPSGSFQSFTVVNSMMRTARFDFQGYLPAQTARTPQQIRQASQPVEQTPGQVQPQTPAPAAPRLLPNGFLQF